MGIFPTRRIVDEDEHGNFIDPDTIIADSSLALLLPMMLHLQMNILVLGKT